jgi:hypothetical protein
MWHIKIPCINKKSAWMVSLLFHSANSFTTFLKPALILFRYITEKIEKRGSNMLIDKIVKTLCGMKSHFKAELAKKKLTADGEALATEIAREVYRHIDNCLDTLKDPNLNIKLILSTLEDNLSSCIDCHSAYRTRRGLLQFEEGANLSYTLKFTVLPLEPTYLLSNLRCNPTYGDKLSKELRADPKREKVKKLIDKYSDSSENTDTNNHLLEAKEEPQPPIEQSQFSFTSAASSRLSERRISSIFRPFLVDNNDSASIGPLSAEDAPAKEDNKKKKRFFGLCC